MLQNLQVREDVPDKAQKVKVLGVYSEDPGKLTSIIKLATALESGRQVNKLVFVTWWWI